MPDDRGLDAVSLIFLADDRDAQRLAVAWPKLAGGGRRAGQTLSPALTLRWASSSGVHIYAVRRLGPVLLEHGICSPDFTTHPTALAYIRSVLAKAVSRGVARSAR